MDTIFKALADNSRRKLLDRLQMKDGQTLRALCSDLAMSRQAVTKHLLLLEEAGLVTTTRQGREKLHYLNPLPLRQISVRWLEKYKRHQPASNLRPNTFATPPVPPDHPIAIDGESRWINLHTL